MSRKMTPGLINLLARKDKRIESHATLQVFIDNGDILRDYRFATARLTIEGSIYEPQLRAGSQIKSSLARASDHASVDVQNADTTLGREFLGLSPSLYGAETRMGTYIKDLQSGAEFHEVFLTGVLVGLQVGETVAQVTAVSDPYANISVGASRRIALSCQWAFRNPNTCGYAGNFLTCNFLLNHIDGCEGRHGGGVGATLKRAKFGGFAFLNSQSRLKTL